MERVKANMAWETEGVTKESVRKQLKLSRKYKSKLYKWQLTRKISRLERKAAKEQALRLRCVLFCEAKKYLDELVRCAK